jgi:hypothetical protein
VLSASSATSEQKAPTAESGAPEGVPAGNTQQSGGKGNRSVSASPSLGGNPAGRCYNISQRRPASLPDRRS